MLSRKNFPIFKNKPDLVYLDASATALKPKLVIEEIIKYYEQCSANVHRSSYRLGIEATSFYENSRNQIAGLLGVKSNEIVFTSGTTQGINLLSLGLKKYLKENDNIVVSDLEHHSNLLPWRALCAEKNVQLRVIKSITGRIDLKDAYKKIDNHTRIIAITHVSNVFGTVQPIDEIAKISSKIGSTLIVDGAQAVGHFHVNLNGLLGNGLDTYVFSGHKAYGPTGIGVLAISNQLVQKIAPVFYGGEMVDSVDDNQEHFSGPPQVLEAGTPNIAGAIGLAGALKLLYSDNKHFEYLSKLNNYLKKRLIKIGVTLHSPEDCDLPIISFSIKGFDAKKISSWLDDQNIAVRSGFMCAEPLTRNLNSSGILRVSLGLWNTKKDINKLLESLSKLKFRPH